MTIRETRTEKLTVKVRPSEEELFAILAEFKTPGKGNISDMLYHICMLGVQRWLETREFFDHNDPPEEILNRLTEWTHSDPHAVAARKRLIDRINRKIMVKRSGDQENVEIIDD